MNKPRNKQNNRNSQNHNAGATNLMDARGAQALLELQGMRGRYNRTVIPSFNHLLGRLNDLQEEGVDHINVSNASTTEIGRVFSLSDELSYRDTMLDATIQNLRTFTFFLKTGMTEPRLLVPYALPRGTPLEDKPVRNMFALQAHALWEKIQAIKPLQEMLQSLAVPLDWYIVKNGQASRTLTGAAYAAALLEIQRALRDGETPDFTEFFDLDVQQELKKLDRTERLVAVENYLAEALIPLRDTLVDIRAEMKAARLEKQRAQEAVRAEMKERSHFQPRQPDQKNGPRRDNRKVQKKTSGAKTLNHMVPDTSNAGPVVNAVDVEIADPSVSFAPPSSILGSDPASIQLVSDLHNVVKHQETVVADSEAAYPAPSQQEHFAKVIEDRFVGQAVVVNENSALAHAFNKAVQGNKSTQPGSGVELGSSATQNNIELGSTAREIELPGDVLVSAPLAATPEVMAQVTKVADAAGDEEVQLPKLE